MLAHLPVRLARRRDVRTIAELSRDVIEHGLRWTYDPATVRRAIANPAVNVAVADDGDRLLAFGIMQYGDTVAHLVLLGVRPGQQRRGLGSHLVAWLEKSALVAGIQCVRVEVRADNPGGRAFYEKLGYSRRRRFVGYYSGRLDALRLEKRLGVSMQPGQ